MCDTCQTNSVAGLLECRVIESEERLLALLSQYALGVNVSDELVAARAVWAAALGQLEEHLGDSRRIQAVRARLGHVQVAEFICSILYGNEILDTEAVDLIYAEYRQIFRCRRPFHMDIANVHDRYRPLWMPFDARTVLTNLVNPSWHQCGATKVLTLIMWLREIVERREEPLVFHPIISLHAGSTYHDVLAPA